MHVSAAMIADLSAAVGVLAGEYPSEPPILSGAPGYPAPKSSQYLDPHLTHATSGSSKPTDLPKPGEECPSAKVVNKCPYPVYLWSVAFDTDGPHEINCGEEYVEKYIKGGVALEIVKEK